MVGGEVGGMAMIEPPAGKLIVTTTPPPLSMTQYPQFPPRKYSEWEEQDTRSEIGKIIYIMMTNFHLQLIFLFGCLQIKSKDLKKNYCGSGPVSLTSL